MYRFSMSQSVWLGASDKELAELFKEETVLARDHA